MGLFGRVADHARRGARVHATERELLVVERACLFGERRRQHPAEALLGLGAQQHLGRKRARDAMEEIETDRGAPSSGGGQLAGGACHAAGAEVLETRGNPALAQTPEELGVGDVQHALEERIGKLHRAALIALSQLVRGEGRAAESALVGRLAHEHERPGARALGDPAPQQSVARRDAERHHVDQTVVVERLVEIDVAAQIGHPEWVRVARDSLHDAARDVARGHAALDRMPEAQRVEHAHHLGAHTPDVAHDAAHSGRRTFDRQELARMVVALVRQHQGEILARSRHRDRARVFSGPDEHLRSARGETLEEMTRRLVGAVLAPQDPEQHGLRPARRPAQELDQERHLVGLERHAARGEPLRHRAGIARLVEGVGGRSVRGHAHRAGSSARAKRSST